MNNLMLRKALLIVGLCGIAGTIALVQRADQRYLFVWTGDADRDDSDFLAVLDVTPSSSHYGTVVAAAPVNERGLQPHHTEHVYSAGHPLFAIGFGGNRSFRFDLRDPLNPKLLGDVQASSSLTFPHSFERLPNGNVLATMQARDADYAAPGGLAEIDDRGRVVRSSSAATPDADNELIRPYSLAVLPERDRVITGSALMGLPSWHRIKPATVHDHRGFHLQLWRLSDLRLLKTIMLPQVAGHDGVHLQPGEPRRLPNGEVLVSTMARCGLYRVTGFDAQDFDAEFVYDFGSRQCAVPVVVGKFWIEPLGQAKRIVVLDVSNPSTPVEVSRVQLDEKQSPHWLSYDDVYHRIVVVNAGSGEDRIWMLDFNPSTGSIKIDERFRDANSNRPGVNFDRQEWPHGNTGRAIPHGSVFASRP